MKTSGPVTEKLPLKDVEFGVDFEENLLAFTRSGGELSENTVLYTFSLNLVLVSSYFSILYLLLNINATTKKLKESDTLAPTLLHFLLEPFAE